MADSTMDGGCRAGADSNRTHEVGSNDQSREAEHNNQFQDAGGNEQPGAKSGDEAHAADINNHSEGLDSMTGSETATTVTNTPTSPVHAEANSGHTGEHGFQTVSGTVHLINLLLPRLPFSQVSPIIASQGSPRSLVLDLSAKVPSSTPAGRLPSAWFERATGPSSALCRAATGALFAATDGSTLRQYPSTMMSRAPLFPQSLWCPKMNQFKAQTKQRHSRTMESNMLPHYRVGVPGGPLLCRWTPWSWECL
ncbi:hypothetical protein IWX90DRAFT_158473 [Phyllosticta citrichinensis]|uniref:Uncharacterized protein n=1 Tax=Phyllosticta citrichinensis TaxID=1130410 RepID=A0ABR1Y061_9PEZI